MTQRGSRGDRSGPAHPGPPRQTGGGDCRGAHRDGTGTCRGHCRRGAPRVLSARSAPTVDHPVLHPVTDVAFLHMGSNRHHVAPRQKSPGSSAPRPPTRSTPGTEPKMVSWWRPRQRRSASRRPFNDTLTRGRAPSCRQVRSRLPRQTQDGSGTHRRHNRWRTPGSPPSGTCPPMPWFVPPRPSKGLSRCPSPLAQPCSAACRRERPGFGGERTDARARTSPWRKWRQCFTTRTWGLWNGWPSCPTCCADG